MESRNSNCLDPNAEVEFIKENLQGSKSDEDKPDELISPSEQIDIDDQLAHDVAEHRAHLVAKCRGKPITILWVHFLSWPI